MATYALYITTSDGAAKTLESNGSQLNLAIGVKDSSGTLNFKTIIQQDAAKAMDLRWMDQFAIKASPASKTKQTPPQLVVKYQQRYTLASDGTATVEYAPNCAINAFEFKTAVKAQVKLFEVINGDPTEVFASQTLNADDPPYTITPTQTFKVWFSNSDGVTSQELVLDFANQLSQIVSYSESGWTLVGPSAYTVGAIFGISITDQGYVVTQEAKSPTLLMPPVDGVDERLAISWSFGPLKVEGYIDTDKLEIGVVVYVLGVNLGQFYGNLTEGLVIKLNLFIIQGEIKLYLQDGAKGKDVWIKVNVNVLGIGPIDLNQMVVAI